MALNDTSPDAVSDSSAAVRMRSWLRRVSARRWLTDPVGIVPSRVITDLERLHHCLADRNPLPSAIHERIHIRFREEKIDLVDISLEVNGETAELTVDPGVTLLDALRERLGITGPKK